jgi:hypothetical protein
MTVYDVGDRVNVDTLVVNATTGAPVNATMTVTVVKPDGTLLTPTPTINNPSTGAYNVDVDTTLPGNYLVTWIASGAAVGRDAYQFYVQPAGFRLVSVTDAKTHINKSATYTGDDNELRTFIDAAGEIVDYLAGPTVNRSVVEYHDGGDEQIFPDIWPVVDVTEVIETWPGGPGYTLNRLASLTSPGTGYDYTFDPVTGAITRRVNAWTRSFVPGVSNIKVTVTAGRAQPWPARIRLASLDLVAYLWRTSQAGRGAGRPQIGVAEATVDVLGAPVPARVYGMLAGMRPPQAGA